MAKSKVSEKELEDDNDERDDSSSSLKPGPGVYSRQMNEFWLEQISQYDQRREGYVMRGNEVIKRFRDDRSKAQDDLKRMNMLWAYIKIMMPALYSKAPTPIVDRKFLDKDPVARLSSMIAERALRNEITFNGFHESMKAAVLDHLLPGQGIVWVRYESEHDLSVSIPAASQTSMVDDLDKIESEEGAPAGLAEREDDEKTDKLEETGEQLIAESIPVDYISWKDVYTLPVNARNWPEVQAVAKRICLSRKEAIKRFGEEIGEALIPDTQVGTTENDRQSGASSNVNIFHEANERNITVFEIWNKSDRRVYWCSRGYEYLCDVRDDPLELSQFFPCPRILLATTTNDTLEPVPDYFEWQDQATMIDELTMRIAMLTKACKVAGTYDGSNNALKRLLLEGVENELIPVDNWLIYAEKGGVPGSVSFLPIKEIQSVIDTLIKVRQTAMQDLDTVTGVNDIMRGTSDSRETLGGIRLKNNNTGTRLSERQKEVARFCVDTVRIIAEVMCKHFSTDTLVEVSGITQEDELSDEQIKAELMMSGEWQKQMQQFMLRIQQQIQPPTQLQTQPLQTQGNVVPFNPSAQQQPPQMAPRPSIPPEAIKVIEEHIIDAARKQKINRAIDLLRSDIPRKYRIDIEVDSTIFADAEKERQDASEFVGSFTKFLQSSEQIVQGMPEAAEIMGKMLQFAVRKYRTGRDLESAIETFIDKITKKAQQMIQNPKPTGEDAKVESEKIKQKGELQKQQLEGQQQQQDNAMHQQTVKLEAQRDMAQDQMEAHYREKEFQLKMAELDRKAQMDQMKHQIEMEALQAKVVAAHAMPKEPKGPEKEGSNDRTGTQTGAPSCRRARMG